MDARSQFWEMFRRVEADLWKAAYKTWGVHKQSSLEGWVLCPRAYAKKYLRCIVELTPEAYPGLPGMLWLAKETFANLDRYHPGDDADLVFAVGDVR